MKHLTTGVCFFCTSSIPNLTYHSPVDGNSGDDDCFCNVCGTPVCDKCGEFWWLPYRHDDWVKRYRLCMDCRRRFPEITRENILDFGRRWEFCECCRKRRVPLSEIHVCKRCERKTCSNCLEETEENEPVCISCLGRWTFQCPACGKVDFGEERQYSCALCGMVTCPSCRRVGKIDGNKIRNVCPRCYPGTTPVK